MRTSCNGPETKNGSSSPRTTTFFGWRRTEQTMRESSTRARSIGWAIIRGLMVDYEVLEAGEMAGRVEYL